MARTFRTVPAWIKSSDNAAWMESKYFQRAARGQDGAVRSEIAQSAKAGKRDDWSTAPKGRANKRIATKQIRAFVKAETTREIDEIVTESKEIAEEFQNEIEMDFDEWIDEINLSAEDDYWLDREEEDYIESLYLDMYPEDY